MDLIYQDSDSEMDPIDQDLDFGMDPFILETLPPLGGAYDIFSQQWELVPTDVEAPARDIITNMYL
jgi:hypothetical protein